MQKLPMTTFWLEFIHVILFSGGYLIVEKIYIIIFFRYLMFPVQYSLTLLIILLISVAVSLSAPLSKMGEVRTESMDSILSCYKHYQSQWAIQTLPTFTNRMRLFQLTTAMTLWKCHKIYSSEKTNQIISKFHRPFPFVCIIKFMFSPACYVSL